MRRRAVHLCIAIVAVALGISLRRQGSRREVGRTPNGDGTATVAWGHPRLMGLFGIEITFAVLDQDGRTLFATGVRDLCRSWTEAKTKHSTPAPIFLTPSS